MVDLQILGCATLDALAAENDDGLCMASVIPLKLVVPLVLLL